MSNTLIYANNIYKEYKDNLVILDNVNLEIKKNNFYSIVGKSGAGKSTLLHLLGLLDIPDKGEIYINGKQTSNLKPKEAAFLRMSTIGFVFQSYHLNNLLKAYENVMLPMYVNPKYNYHDMEIRADELLKLVGLEHRKHHFPNELSGGEQQRIAIARALANDPDCILADEPTGNLDKENESNIFNIFKELVNIGKSVVVISHNESVKNYTDTIYELKNGELEEKH
ncbi:ABC transporter ATP-binding protein [Bacillus thuringiensis]|uniref:ABC transporter ATP-binding protein n=4 Tax=Bacillus thuringiensis TaxID=1428 RepID=A0AB35PLQ7_BACTU|nr:MULTISPECIES: ABC transporter ATP-binding protein [Bacillus]EAO55718.1 ABC transporter ATP-binding protein [Bacillus thuringiensis serovar israelensis ATCC 35646]MEC3434473.1 ABC transporter ATP-binding protein [Bacillus cereus]MED1157447.1 ABC transporter ATP-binding protein [Bacillus paranthracis]AFQ24747.1 ABC transporter-like protein [Bacillus thuringiensis HD-789]AJH05389.1 ABC transporter family protein [Bacillus thuringiensis HD1002]